MQWTTRATDAVFLNCYLNKITNYQLPIQTPSVVTKTRDNNLVKYFTFTWQLNSYRGQYQSYHITQTRSNRMKYIRAGQIHTCKSTAQMVQHKHEFITTLNATKYHKSFAHANESADSIKGGEYLDKLNYY
jgi:hypothetical protein